MAELPKAPVKRLLANAGARRVSDDAVDAFVKQKTETDKTKSKASDLLEQAFENVQKT